MSATTEKRPDARHEHRWRAIAFEWTSSTVRHRCATCGAEREQLAGPVERPPRRGTRDA